MSTKTINSKRNKDKLKNCGISAIFKAIIINQNRIKESK